MRKLIIVEILAVFALFVTLCEGKRYMNLMCHTGYNVNKSDQKVGEGLALKIEKDCMSAEKNDKICYKHCVLKKQGILNEAGNFLNSEEGIIKGIGRLFDLDAKDTLKKLAGDIETDCFNIATEVRFERCFWGTPKFYDCIQNSVGC